MKNYIIKSSIVFFMVLILGLILLPMIQTEKRFIKEEQTIINNYELLVDEENLDYRNVDGDIGGYRLTFNAKDYNIILFSIEFSGVNLQGFILKEKNNYIVNIYDTDVYAWFTTGDNITIVAPYMGEAVVSIWGVIS